MVVVTINYRIGALGFLATEEAAEPNLWLSDQIAAMDWVRRNIERFGGDPEQITVAGESGGAFSALSLAVSEVSSPWIRRVILQSAPLGLRLATPQDTMATTRRIMDLLGCATIEQLRAVPSEALIGATLQLMPLAARFGHWSTPFVPTIGSALLPQHPLDAFIDGAAADIDVLVGWNADEASFAFALNPSVQGLDDSRVLERLAERFSPADSAYASYASRAASGDDVPRQVLEAIVSDELFIQPAVELAESRRDARSVFAYHFAFRSLAHDGRLGATHCFELPFTFANLERWSHAPFAQGLDPDAFQETSTLMHEAWISFIRTGDPGTGTRVLVPVRAGAARHGVRLSLPGGARSRGRRTDASRAGGRPHASSPLTRSGRLKSLRARSAAMMLARATGIAV
ncbi:carboxylesterase family protein [Microbacterium sp. NIBRBAC000506063]|nr:carboxylesterase family protein [Microbacterium sp. NIBRBAC000506063]